MADRWNHRTVVVDNEREPKFFVPGGPSGEETEHGAGFKVRVRGAGGHVTHAYRCPVHGLFDASVERAAVPDEVPCSIRLSAVDSIVLYGRIDQHGSYCGLTSPWAGSFCGQGVSSGECAT